MKFYVVLATAGAALIATGVALWNIPAGLVTAGAEFVAAGYVGSYLTAKVASPR